MSIIKNKLFFLREAYFGKTNEIEELEFLFTELQEEFKKDKLKNINKSENIKKIEKKTTEIFNFKDVSLNILADNSKMNAFVLDVLNWKELMKNRDIKYADGYNYTKTNNGYRFNKALIYPAISINSYLLSKNSPEEIMAIYLHEIGHTFFYMQKIRGTVSIGFLLAYILDMIMELSKNPFKSGITDLEKISKIIVKMDKAILAFLTLISPKLGNAYIRLVKGSAGALWRVSIILTSPKVILAPILSALITAMSALGLLVGLAVPAKLVKNSIANLTNNWLFKSYDNEKFADNFATSYGYGESVASVFSKTNNGTYENAVRTEFGVKAYEAFYYLMSFYTITDPHPDNFKRVELTKKKLEHELKNKDLSPDTIKEIKAQISNIDKLMKSEDSVIKIHKAMSEGFGKVKETILGDKSDEEIFDL